MNTATDIKGTFLPIERIAGKAYNATDFAVLSGVMLGYNRKAVVWSASSNVDGYVRVVIKNGNENCIYPFKRDAGAVPALLSSSSSSPIKPSEARLSGKIFDYPQTVASDEVSKELEKAYLNDATDLKATNRTYTYDSERHDAYSKPCNYEKLQEYEYQGKTYVRIKGQPRDEDSVLANGHKVEEGRMYWVEVEPLKDQQMALYRPRFSDSLYYNGVFSQTFANKFLNETVLPEMQQVRDMSKYPTRESDTARTAAIADARKNAIDAALAKVAAAQATLDAELKNLSALVAPSNSPAGQTDVPAVDLERTRATG